MLNTFVVNEHPNNEPIDFFWSCEDLSQSFHSRQLHYNTHNQNRYKQTIISWQVANTEELNETNADLGLPNKKYTDHGENKYLEIKINIWK